MTERPATYRPVHLPPEELTAAQLRMANVNGRPVVELRYPNSNDYYTDWRLPYITARAIYAYICSMRRAGRTDNPIAYKSGRLFQGSPFTRRRVKVCKNEVRIGCQHLLYSEIAVFAASQGWPALPLRKRKV